jgi:hypothetical protein
MNKEQPMLRDEGYHPQLATSKNCQKGIRNPYHNQTPYIFEWRNNTPSSLEIKEQTPVMQETDGLVAHQDHLHETENSQDGTNDPSQSEDHQGKDYIPSRSVDKSFMARGHDSLKNDSKSSEKIASERFVKNSIKPSFALDVSSSQTGLMVPVETKPSIPSKQVGTSDPTCPNNSPKMYGKDTVHSIAVEPHVLCVPGHGIPDVQDHVHHEDPEELTQSSTMNPSHEQDVVHKTEDLQVLSQTLPASNPRIVESEHQDVRTQPQGLVIE